MRFGPLTPREKLTLSVTTADMREARIAELERRIAAVRSELLSNDELLTRVRDEMTRERPNCSTDEVWPLIQSPLLLLIHEYSEIGDCLESIYNSRVVYVYCALCRPQKWSCRCALWPA